LLCFTEASPSSNTTLDVSRVISLVVAISNVAAGLNSVSSLVLTRKRTATGGDNRDNEGKVNMVTGGGARVVQQYTARRFCIDLRDEDGGFPLRREMRRGRSDFDKDLGVGLFESSLILWDRGFYVLWQSDGPKPGEGDDTGMDRMQRSVWG